MKFNSIHTTSRWTRDVLQPLPAWKRQTSHSEGASGPPDTVLGLVCWWWQRKCEQSYPGRSRSYHTTCWHLWSFHQSQEYSSTISESNCYRTGRLENHVVGPSPLRTVPGHRWSTWTPCMWSIIQVITLLRHHCLSLKDAFTSLPNNRSSVWSSLIFIDPEIIKTQLTPILYNFQKINLWRLVSPFSKR